MAEPTVREKTEQVMIPLKAELVWFFILLVAIAGGIYGMKAAYEIGYRHGVYSEKVADLEDIVFNQQEMRHEP